MVDNCSFTLPDKMRKWLEFVDGDARFRAVSSQPITFFQHQRNPNHGQWPMTFSRIYDLHTWSTTQVVQTLSSSVYLPVVPYVQHVHSTSHYCPSHMTSPSEVDYVTTLAPSMTSWLVADYVTTLVPSMTSWLVADYVTILAPSMTSWLVADYVTTLAPSMTSWLVADYVTILAPSMTSWLETSSRVWLTLVSPDLRRYTQLAHSHLNGSELKWSIQVQKLYFFLFMWFWGVDLKNI